MPRTRISQNAFTAGELSPDMYRRWDFDKYNHGLKECTNARLKPHGGAERRYGMRYVATAATSIKTRLERFVFSADQAYVLEIGRFYIRFYRDGGQLVDGLGDPVEVVTTYGTVDIDDLQFVQDKDILYIFHPDFAPRKLRRFSDTEWDWVEMAFSPPPTVERGDYPNGTLTPGAVTGSAVTFTSSVGAFQEADIDRLIVYDQSLAIIVGVSSSTVCTADIISDFPSTDAIAADDWSLAGSPVCDLSIDKTGPYGAKVTIYSLRHRENATELISNGDFADLGTDWDDHSGPLLASGTSDGTSSTNLQDAASTFLNDGIEAGHRAINNTDGTEDTVEAVVDDQNLTTSAGGADWTGGGDSFTIRETGSVAYSGGNAQLDGGANGVAWIQQDITTINTFTYLLTFDVIDQPLSVRVGSTSKGAELYSEATFDIGTDHEVEFTATGTTTYIQFRNNQDVVAKLDNVSCRALNVAGFGVEDDGRYLKLNDGIVQITERNSAYRVTGVVLKPLSTDDNALAGSWSLEDEAWSGPLGYPRAATFNAQRLIVGGTATYPARFWGSVPGSNENFAVGVEDTDAFDYSVASTTAQTIQWMNSERGLIIGTQTDEYLVTGSLGGTITPTSIDVRPLTHYGSEYEASIKAGSAVLYVARGGRRVREILFDNQVDDRLPNDLTLLAEHLFTGRIKRLAYQQEPVPVVWVVTVDERLHYGLYLRDQDILGWSEYETEGDVWDVVVIPHPDGDRDQVWVLVERNINGDNTYIEYLDDSSGYYERMVVDSGLTETYSPATSTVSGLDHLEGETVWVLVDGARQADKTVSGGEITLDTAGEEVEVGLGYEMVLDPLPPTVGGQPLTGLKVANAKVTVSLVDTLGAEVNGYEINTRVPGDLMDGPPSLVSGDVPVDMYGRATDNPVRVTHNAPFPCTVLAITRSLEVEDV